MLSCTLTRHVLVVAFNVSHFQCQGALTGVRSENSLNGSLLTVSWMKSKEWSHAADLKTAAAAIFSGTTRKQKLGFACYSHSFDSCCKTVLYLDLYFDICSNVRERFLKRKKIWFYLYFISHITHSQEKQVI